MNFTAAAAFLITFAVAFVLAPPLIKRLHALNYGQLAYEDAPKSHQKKSGTPTMGGIAIVISAVVGYFVPHFLRSDAHFSRGGLLVMFAFVGGGAVGLVDDWIKITRKRSLGLNKRAKILGQLGVATAFAVPAFRWAHVRANVGFTRFEFPSVTVPRVVWLLFAIFMVIRWINKLRGSPNIPLVK